MAKTRVLVIDSCQIFIVGLIRLLSDNNRIELYNIVHNGEFVVETIEGIKPDIILLDFKLLNQEENGFFNTLRERYPETKIMVLIPARNIDSVLDTVIKYGARGIVPKSIDPNELAKSVVEMIDKGAYIHPTLIPNVMEKMVAGHKQNLLTEDLLSTREKEILNLVAKGESNQEIADALFLSVHTVKGHIKKINQKLKLENRVEMSRYALFHEITENGKTSKKRNSLRHN